MPVVFTHLRTLPGNARSASPLTIPRRDGREQPRSRGVTCRRAGRQDRDVEYAHIAFSTSPPLHGVMVAPISTIRPGLPLGCRAVHQLSV